MMMVCCVASLSSVTITHKKHRVPYENMIIYYMDDDVTTYFIGILLGLRCVSDPEYDPHTLLVPADYFKRQTPGHKQWWKEKSRNFDAVIFFKVGNYVSQA